MAVYLVLGSQRAVLVRDFSDTSSTIAPAPQSRRGGFADHHSRGEREAKRRSGRTPRRTSVPGKNVRIAALALIAAFAGGYAGLAATAVAVTVAVTICAVSALLGARFVLGAARTNELASWIALAASIAGLAFAVAVVTMVRHEPVSACQAQLPTGGVDRRTSSASGLQSRRLKAPSFRQRSRGSRHLQGPEDVR